MNIDFAILQVESQGNDDAIGDTNLPQHAYGPMQIRQMYCDDVNRVYGTKFQAKQLLGRRSLSLAVFWLYMSIYATSAQLGRPVTNEDRARIHNGGPSAWNANSTNPVVKKLYAATTPYWNKVKAQMASGSA